MTALSKKTIMGAIIPILLLLIVTAIYFTITNHETSFIVAGGFEPTASWKDNTAAASTVQKDANPVQAQHPASNQPNASVSPAPIEAWNPMGDATSRAEILSWFESRGNFNFEHPEAQNDYKNYDDATLEKLSESGDLRAMHLLSERAESIDETKEILNRAAAWGSTEAINRLGLAIETEKNIYNLPAEARKPHIFESLAFYEASQLRGDWWGKIGLGDSVLRRYPTELTQQDKNYIEQRGREIYDEFQKERHKLNLGEFDNSTPDSVIKFYEEMIRPL